MDKTQPTDPPKRSLKQRQREERAALILRTANALLIEKGYYATSIDEIAARVGISKGTVYLHFASKEDLLTALIEQQIVEFLALVDAVISQPGTVRARLERILAQAYGSIQTERRLLAELPDTISLTKTLIQKRPALSARVDEVMARIASLFEEGKRTGELSPAVPTPLMVTTFIGLLSLNGYEQFLTSGQYSADELVVAVSHTLFAGWSAGSSAGEKGEIS